MQAVEGMREPQQIGNGLLRPHRFEARQRIETRRLVPDRRLDLFERRGRRFAHTGDKGAALCG